MTNATTGSERIVPGQQPPAGERSPLLARLARLARPAVRNWQFGLVVLAAVAVRVIVVIGYPPILWFNDSYNYIQDAVTHIPDEIRPNGYPFLLDLLLPLHSDYAIGLLQAAMGVSIGVAIYALLRHRGLPWWGATLPALPVLFDSYELHLEHMITADPLFIFLVTIAVVILCWSDRPSVLTMAIAGLLIGYATIVRSVGEPLLIVVLIAMLARRVGWRRLLTLAVTGIVPIGAYMLWFHSYWGQYTITESAGPFLYSRVSTFAECSKLNLPADLRYLCDSTKPQYRPAAGQYIWSDGELPPYQDKPTPMYAKLKNNTARRFTATVNAQTRQFAEHAIESQPLDYVRVVTKDILHSFGWNRQPDPGGHYENANGNGPTFRFVTGSELDSEIPWYATPVQMSAILPRNYCGAICRAGDKQARQVQMAEKDFAGQGYGFTRAVAPWVRLLQIYQRYIYLRGTLLGIIVLIGAAGVVARWRRWGGLGLLPWLVGALLIVLPPMTAGFSYRYVLAAVPAACLAAGLAFTRRPGSRSVRALAADLRRHFGRGVAVEQE